MMGDGELVLTARQRCAGLFEASRKAGRTDLSGALEWLSQQLRSRQVAATVLLLLPLLEDAILKEDGK